MAEATDRLVKSVSEINAEIRQLLETEYRFVRVRGEVSTVRQPFSGHLYFILKDEHSQLNAVLFKNQQRWLSRELAAGQEVVCDGRISVYEARGQYQLIVDSIDFDGTGQLRLLFEQLKQRLRDQGLFAVENKRPLPARIEHLVLITSPTGAAVHDFLSVCRQRRADVLVQILPVRVQGIGAAAEICRAIDIAQTLAPDLIALCRGGGSIEDLWAFNEEEVARAIHRSTIPVVTGIGHEIDFTIADFTADLRCATPTAAAELVTTDPAGFAERLRHLQTRLGRAIAALQSGLAGRLTRAADVLSTFDRAFSHHTFTVEHLWSRLHGAMQLYVERQSARFVAVEARLRRRSPESALTLQRSRLDHLSNIIERCIVQTLETRENRLAGASAVLDTLSPLKTLARGYSIVSRKVAGAGTPPGIVTSVDQVTEGEEIGVRLDQGELDCTVLRRRR